MAGMKAKSGDSWGFCFSAEAWLPQLPENTFFIHCLLDGSSTGEGAEAWLQQLDENPRFAHCCLDGSRIMSAGSGPKLRFLSYQLPCTFGCVGRCSSEFTKNRCRVAVIPISCSASAPYPKHKRFKSLEPESLSKKCVGTLKP